MSKDMGPVRLWRVLLTQGHTTAAGGLLVDLFEQVRLGDASSRPENRIAGEDREAAQNFRAAIRGELMEIIDDADGDKLRHWVNLFGTDRDKFWELAMDYAEHAYGKNLED